jgi:hypothetical protein
MKILAQNYRTGELQMLEVPNPSGKRGMLVVQTMVSLVFSIVDFLKMM